MIKRITLIIMMATLSQAAMAVPMMTLPDFSVLAEQNSDVVVNIRAHKTLKSKNLALNPQIEGLSDELLKRFFGLPGQHGRSDKKGGKKESNAVGSGFILSADGYIVTNYHVIEGADKIVVKMRNRQELLATLIGADKRTDIALLKIDANNLTPAKIGRSSQLKVGQWVLAIGAPFGLDYTLTHGIVSALGRALPDDTYVPFIQTDVSINPGNSGGPLINMEGQVVGVNSQIYSKSGGSMGLSFSIPIDLAMNVITQLKKTGTVSRGFLGVQVQEVDASLAESFGLDKPMGALITEIIPNSAASNSALQPGDVILTFDGHHIARSSALPPIVGTTTLERDIRLIVLRNGTKHTIRVRLLALNEAPKKVKKIEKMPNTSLLDAEFANVPKAQLAELNVDVGVRVIRLANGVAKEAGIKVGDVLISINFNKIRSVKALSKLLKKLPKNRALPVRIIRGERSLFLPLSLR